MLFTQYLKSAVFCVWSVNVFARVMDLKNIWTSLLIADNCYCTLYWYFTRNEGIWGGEELELNSF